MTSGLPADGALETTASLLKRVRAGDTAARSHLLTRYLPALRGWAHGRLPSRARDLVDTDDLVQVTLIRALDRMEDFEPRWKGSFLAYLRRILLNQIRDEGRRAGRRPEIGELDDDLREDSPSPLEQTIGRETLETYEEALSRLTEEQREAVVMRIELGFTHEEIAEALGSPTANAARMIVARGLVRLAELMDERR